MLLDCGYGQTALCGFSRYGATDHTTSAYDA
jgi:hypothetical protein